MKTFITKAKTWLGRKLFKGEYAYIEGAKKNVEAALSKLEEREQMFQKQVLSLSVVDVVREQLRGFNPKKLDNPDDDILTILEREEKNVDEFLKQMRDISDMWGWQYLCDHLTREQVLHSAKTATTLEAINFGRATVNGVSLAREEVDRFAGIQKERNLPPEQFDKHKALSE